MRYLFWIYILVLVGIGLCGCHGDELGPGDDNTKLDEGFEQSFDWRNQIELMSPQNQMALSSCGVFQAMNVFEAAIARTTGKSVNLSEQHYINASTSWNGETGVSPTAVFEFMKESGIVLDEHLPYQNQKTNEVPNRAPDYFLTSWGEIVVNEMTPEQRRRTLKQALLDHGPVCTPIAFYEDLDRYRSGIYQETESSPIQGGHWLTIVGWYDDLDLPSKGYWICKNCWGPEWGEGGYARIAYNDASGIDNFVFLYAEYAPTITVQSTETLPVAPHGGYHTRWSPDGNKLVYTARYAGKCELWFWDTATQSHYPIVEGVDGDMTPNWSSDSKEIVFDAYPQTGYGLQSWIKDLEQDTVYQLTHLNHHTITPAFSLDGTQLASFDGSQLRLYTIQTGASTVIPNSQTCGQPHWSPDGSTLVCTSGEQEVKDIYTIRPDGSGKTQITSFQGREDRPRWSPDGSMVVYERFMTGRVDSWITHLATGLHFEIVQNANNPDWLPDGRLVYCNQAGFHVVVLNSDFGLKK